LVGFKIYNMKTIRYIFISVVVFSTIVSQSSAQLAVNGNLTPEEMVQFFVGSGINYSNVLYTGADTARGIFTNGGTTNLGVDHGLALTSGTIQNIPGPDNNSGASGFNSTPGDSLLSVLVGTVTYDACVLEFDFVPASDTAWCDFVFGSEEYPEYVGSTFNDVFGFFVSGPNPDGGNYEFKNIALVPGTDLPVAINNVNAFYYPEYYVDNTGGLTIQYDGFTTVLTAKCAVVAGATYHFKLAVADAGDGILDSGVLLEAESFESQGSAEFMMFSFLSELNPQLPEDIIGEISGNNVYLTVPDGTDLTNLIASFDTPGGVIVAVGSEIQQSGITPNDFTVQVNYHLDGVNIKDWVVKVDFLSEVVDHSFDNVIVYPNPAVGKFELNNISEVDVQIYSIIGTVVKVSQSGEHGNNLLIDNLVPGIYFVELKKDGKTETRRVVVN
jgi:hypothetical protein